MINWPFVTDLNSQAVVKSSRDPLRFQAIWTIHVRHAVGNLTPDSTSVRDLAVQTSAAPTTKANGFPDPTT
jgi:hypothetical protein